MALTPCLVHELYSGQTPPATPPEFPNEAAQYVQYSGTAPGSTMLVAVFHWDPVSQQWLMQSSQSANWLSVEACGWYGKHNQPRSQSPAHSLFPAAGTWVPQFSVSVVSGKPIPFDLMDLATNSIIASGVLPPSTAVADASTCALTTTSGASVTSFNLTGSTRVVCVPTGGHSAMPGDGETFEASGIVIC